MIWYEDEVKRVEQEKRNLGYAPQTLFYGSSSIRLWTNLYTDLADRKPINLGFGGSTLAACSWYFDRIMAGLQPQQMVFYAGDNDLGDGRHPEEIFIFFQQLASQVKCHFPHLQFYFISIKPSLSRWNIIDQIRYTNTLIKDEIGKLGPDFHYIDIVDSMLDDAGKPQADLFQQDGLHLSDKGYLVWKEIVRQHVQPVS